MSLAVTAVDLYAAASSKISVSRSLASLLGSAQLLEIISYDVRGDLLCQRFISLNDKIP